MISKGVKSSGRDSETENQFAEFRNKISELREQNKLLKQRVIVSQQQVQAAQQMKKSNTIYDGVSSKIDTVKKYSKLIQSIIAYFKGQPKRMPSPLLHNLRVIGPRDSFRLLSLIRYLLRHCFLQYD